VNVDAAVDTVILERADQFETGAIANVREARIPMTAEIALKDSAVGCAIEDRAPCFQFTDAVG